MLEDASGGGGKGVSVAEEKVDHHAASGPGARIALEVEFGEDVM